MQYLQRTDGASRSTHTATPPTPKIRRGFTIVELLIVIVIIAILAAITIVVFNGTLKRARDSVRANDTVEIRKLLLSYQIDNGGLPRTSVYGGSGPGGWNLSSSASWLSFLGTTYGQVPVDPVNTGTIDPGAGGLTYFYYCYNAGSGQLPATANVAIGYRSEASGQTKRTNFSVEKCL